MAIGLVLIIFCISIVFIRARYYTIKNEIDIAAENINNLKINVDEIRKTSDDLVKKMSNIYISVNELETKLNNLEKSES